MVSINVDEQLVLRTFEPRDAAELFSAVEASRAHLRVWLNWVDGTRREDDSLQFIQQSILNINNQQGLELAIVNHGKIIGSIGMHNWDHELKKASLGYWIDKEHQGLGIVKKGLVRFIDYLFYNAGLNKVEIHFVVSNKRSARVAERLGCKIEGVLHQSYLRNGMLEDMVITGLLKSEWQGRKQE